MSSIKPTLRHSQSTQISTFGQGSRAWNDLPQGNPGPNAYSELYPKPPEHRAYTNDGFSFPKQGSDKGNDGFLKISLTPGPGRYEPKLPKSGTSKPMLGGKDQRIDEPEKDNGVPGPGMYNAVHSHSVPSFAIV